MVTVDNERRYLAANRAGRLLFRLSLAEMRERQISDFTPPHMEPLLERAWASLMSDGSVTGRYDVSFLDGSQLEIVYSAIANVLPGQHLIVFAPAEWREDELGPVEERFGPGSSGCLSPREREVLTLIAAGADLEQIAQELSISLHTVRTHVLKAYRRLGANNRAHAIALAMHQGLIELPAPAGRSSA